MQKSLLFSYTLKMITLLEELKTRHYTRITNSTHIYGLTFTTKIRTQSQQGKFRDIQSLWVVIRGAVDVGAGVTETSLWLNWALSG